MSSFLTESPDFFSDIFLADIEDGEIENIKESDLETLTTNLITCRKNHPLETLFIGVAIVAQFLLVDRSLPPLVQSSYPWSPVEDPLPIVVVLFWIIAMLDLESFGVDLGCRVQLSSNCRSSPMDLVPSIIVANPSQPLHAACIGHREQLMKK